MAEQPVKYNQVYEKDLFDNFIKSTEEALKTLNKLNEGLKDTLKETQQIANQKVFEGDLESLKRREKAIDDNRKAVEGLDKIEKERLRLEERLKTAQDARSVANEKLKKQIADQIKQNKEIAGTSNKSSKQIERLKEKEKALTKALIENKKQNREAQKQRKKAFIEKQKAEKQAEKLLQNLEKEKKKVEELRLKKEKELTEEEKLREKLKEAKSDEAKVTASLRLEIQKANRANREASRIAQGAKSPYDSLSATLNDLKKQYKDIAIAQGENSREAKALLKQIIPLDERFKDIGETLGEGRRTVGLYNRALRGVEKQTERVNRRLNELRALGIVQVIASIASSFTQTEQGANLLNKGLNQLTIRLTVFVNALVQGFNTIDKSAGVLEKIEQFFEGTSKALEGYTDQVDNAIDAQNAFLDIQLNATRRIAGLTIQLGKAQASQAEIAIEANDSTTLSIKEQQEALEELEKRQLQSLQLELRIAKEEEFIANQKRKASLEARGDDKADAAIELELAQATQARLLAEGQLIQAREEIAKRNREVVSDAAELELDILIDAADKQKQINDEIVADDRIALDKRFELAKEIRRDINDTFDEQIRVIEGVKKARLNELADEQFAGAKALKGVKGREEERKELLREGIRLREDARNFEINANELISESDTKRLNTLVSNLELSDRIQTRALEVINERRRALKDLENQETSLNETRKEANQQQADNLLTTRALFDLQQDGVNLNKVLQQLEKDRLQAEIDALQQRLLIAEKGSPELLAIQAQLNEKLLQQQQDRINKQTKAEQEATQALIALGEEVITRRLDAQDEAIDRELQAVQRRQDQLRAISEQGRADAEQALAFEQRREAELLRQQEQQQRRRARLQLAISAVETYSSKVNAGDENALASTIRDISFLQAFVASLPAFYEGAENVGDHLGLSKIPGATKDPYLARLHGGERVVKDSLNAQLPSNMSNEELVMAGLAYREPKESTAIVVNQTLTKDDMREVMIEAVKRMPEYRGLQYDPLEEAITQTWKNHNKKVKRHTKTGKTSLFN